MKIIAMKLGITLMVIAMLAGVAFGGDVLLNGNFENWDNTTTPTSWDHVESVTQESAIMNNGMYSAKQAATSTSDLGQIIPGITAGSEYTLTLYYKVTVGDATSARIWSYWRNDGTNITDNADELRGPDNSYFDNNDGAWTKYTVTLTAPATADQFYFEVRTYSGAIVYWDDFSFVVATTAIDAPTALTPTAISKSQIDLTWTENANGNDVLVVYDCDGTFEEPTDLVSYSGSALGGTVIYNGNAQAFSHTALTANTQYFYKAWSVDGTGSYSSGITTDATTLIDEQATENVFISEMCDPKGDYLTNRFIEIYNANSVAVDLTGWKVVAISNDGSSEIFTWTLSGTIAAGDALVCGDDENTLIDCDFEEVDWSTSNTAWNGKTGDGANLYNKTTLVDNAGSHGSFENKSTVRASTVVTESNPFDSGEWTSSATTAYESATPGTHDCSAPEIPLPITLSSFSADVLAGAVELSWETASETNNAQFIIYRNDEVIATVDGAGTTSETNNYTLTDNAVKPGAVYTYVLADLSTANVENKYEAKAITVEMPTAESASAEYFVIAAAYPNPFNPTAQLPITIMADAKVRIALYDLTGRQVAEIANGTLTSGHYNYSINGANLSAGIYLLQTSIDNTLNVQKLVLSK